MRLQGSGVAVKVIAELHNAGWSVDSLAAQFDMTLADVHAALAHYYDHKADIDVAIQHGQALAAAVPSVDVLHQACKSWALRGELLTVCGVPRNTNTVQFNVRSFNLLYKAIKMSFQNLLTFSAHSVLYCVHANKHYA